MDNNNYINAEIYINEEDINQNIRIINSYEKYRKKRRNNKEDDYINENEIKKCEIKINDEIIPFCYFYQFNQKGKYNIKYSFSNKLTNMSYMFYECNYLKKSFKKLTLIK